MLKPSPGVLMKDQPGFAQGLAVAHIDSSQRRVHTTLAKQLVLDVTLYSLQMAADLPTNYNAHLTP